MAKAMKIAIIDDEQDMRQSISQWLALTGFETETFASAEDALKTLGPDYPGIVVSDIKMPGMDGMRFLKKLKGVDSALPVIMITGHGDVPMAVEAMRLGAFDFLEKPFNPDNMTKLAKRPHANAGWCWTIANCGANCRMRRRSWKNWWGPVQPCSACAKIFLIWGRPMGM